MSRETLYFDDLVVGRKFAGEATFTVTADDIKRFAAEYDPQPFHLDEAAARDTFFRGLAASGWHTAAITMRLLVTDGPKLAGGIVGMGGEIAWPAPTRPGDILRLETEVVESVPSKSRPDRGVVRLRTRTLNQRGEAVYDQTARLMVPRRVA